MGPRGTTTEAWMASCRLHALLAAENGMPSITIVGTYYGTAYNEHAMPYAHCDVMELTSTQWVTHPYNFFACAPSLDWQGLPRLLLLALGHALRTRPGAPPRLAHQA